MKTFIYLLLVAAPLRAQTPSTKPPSAEPEMVTLQIDCTTAPLSQKACTSFNELALARDSEVMSLLKMDDVYVCLRADEDAFSIVALATPPDADFVRLTGGGLRATGVLTFSQFKNGQADEYRSVFGTWRKTTRADAPSFVSDPKSATSAFASSAEVSLNYDFKNISGGITSYSLQMRRSTLRAKETLQWNNPTKNPKSPAPDTGSYELDGLCKAF